MTLAEKHCQPCESKDILPMPRQEAEQLLVKLKGWLLTENAKGISRRFKCKDFAHALDFVNQIADIAEHENHHPDIVFGWGYCEVFFTTHAIDGLHENDFIMAAKINAIYVG